MRNSFRDEVGTNRGDMTSLRNSREDVRKSVRNNVKKNGRGRVALPQAPRIFKEITNIPININSSVAPHDQLHDTVNHPTVKPFCKKHLSQETPADRIIGLFKI